MRGDLSIVPCELLFVPSFTLELMSVCVYGWSIVSIDENINSTRKTVAGYVEIYITELHNTERKLKANQSKK